MKWILYFSKKGFKLDKVLKLSEKEDKLWHKFGYLIDYEEDKNCEDYQFYEGTEQEAKSYAGSFRDRKGKYIL